MRTTARSFGGIDYTRTFSASLVNQFRFNAQRANTFQAVPARDLPKPTDLGIGVISDHPTGPPNLSFDSGMSTGFSVQGPTSLIDNTYNWSDTLSWTKGHHAMKLGGWYTPYQDNTVYDFYINGTFYFYGASGSSFSRIGCGLTGACGPSAPSRKFTSRITSRGAFVNGMIVLPRAGKPLSRD